MTKRNTKLHSLTELQQAILDFLWAAGSGTAEQIREALMPGHPLKDSSVRTLLRRLEAHGYLKHRIEGKIFVYEAAVAQQSIAARAVANIIHRFCSGSAEQFLIGMVDEKVLSAEEIQSLARKIRKSK
jgi:BlaI family transcriptional regulator, penicillinase repressor